MTTLLRLLKMMLPFSHLLLIAIFLGSLMVASNMALLGMAAYLIAAAALMPLLVALTIPIYIVRLAAVVRPASRYLERMLSHDITFRLLTKIRVQVYMALEPLLPAQLPAYRSGDILARLVSDVEELQNIFLQIVSPLTIWLVIIILTFAILSLFSALLAWISLAFLLSAGLCVPFLSGLLARQLGMQHIATRAELKAHLVDGVQGMQDLLTCDGGTAQSRKIALLDKTLGRIQRRMATISGLQIALNDALMNLALWVILVSAIPLVSNSSIHGVYLAFLALLILASFESVTPLAQAMQSLGHSLAAGNRLFAVIDAPPQVDETVMPLPAPTRNALYEVEFEHVHFCYHPDDPATLSDISFRLQAGHRIAVIGPSGAGKSTLAGLILRFWDPTAGTIRLNGKDIKDFALADLRSLFGVVEQDTYLFNDTVRNNLLLARPQASIEELEQAIEQAGLTEMMRQLPQGLDTWIGEQGLRLSGGERQRVAIARALLKDAPILILDEATAHLDPLTEQEVNRHLDQLMQGRTSLIITHRLLNMEHMDEIFILDHGRICQHGTHATLIQQDGPYRHMVELQYETLKLV